ncbi:Holliday junction resolvase RuvX [Candidatus Schneideria nysicola]|uniref:Holliday junction resolvase RuvX n=1 Tax=Candidatus Schneideria nysicola TaxID=1081631 RepID=UPI001CAA7207|nr:Holliday junction resolvase RuvX [Candidatus Schneideria nysicola]UAJ66243.1 Holliday junction resolvase RuvX [Candidatus Schneideria nysicola]
MIRHNIIAFDFGMRNIGVAVGQYITCTAQPLKSCIAKKGIPNWTQIEKIIMEWLPTIIIVGLPLNMDGSEQFISIKSRLFANQLYILFKIKVVLYDERLTTVEAKNNLFLMGGYRALKKNKIDSLSAVVLLESWLSNRDQRDIFSKTFNSSTN